MREQLHKVARDYGCRPSSLLGLPPVSWDALLVDSLCAQAGWSRTASILESGKAFPVFDVRSI